MKMINDMDLYYADTYAKMTQPAWMKAERINYCATSADRKANLLSRLFSVKKAR